MRYKLLKVMNEKGYTQDKLARKLGCTKKTVNLWVNGKNRPFEYNMNKLAELFGMPVSQVVNMFWE